MYGVPRSSVFEIDQDTKPLHLQPLALQTSIIAFLKRFVAVMVIVRKLQKNRSNLIKGAQKKYNEGIITSEELNEIKEIIEAADFTDFQPLLYIILFLNVSLTFLRRFQCSKRAHPLSQEYIIEELPTELFDAI